MFEIVVSSIFSKLALLTSACPHFFSVLDLCTSLEFINIMPRAGLSDIGRQREAYLFIPFPLHPVASFSAAVICILV